MVRDHGRAEDITQEVFMSALRRMRATDTPIAFKPWLYEIAKNACIDAFRRSRKAEEVSFDADDGSERIQLVSTNPSPDAAVDARMSIENLRGAFGGLSEAHHQILVMRELEGLSYRDIGERLGMSRASVESTLFRARRRLSEEYEELVSGERCRRIQATIAQAGDGRMGARDTRRMARHVSHCQPCRRAALAAGLDVAPRRTARERIAALLPLPAFLKERLAGGGLPDDGGATMAGGHGSALAKWTATATQYADAADSGWGKAAAIAATLIVAGAGVGAATHGTTLGVGGAGAKSAPAPTASPAAAKSSAAPARERKATVVAGRKASGAGTRRVTHAAKHPASKASSPTRPGHRARAGRTSAAAPASGSSTSGGAAATVKRAADAAAGTASGTAGGILGGVTSSAGKTARSVPGSAGTRVPDVAGSAGKALGNTTTSAGNTVSGATGAVGGAVSGTTGAVGGAVSGATGGSGGGVVGGAGAAVGQTVGGVGGAVGQTVDGVGGAVGQTAGGVGGAVGGIVGGG